MKNKKAFTLIELVSVLVILAILALIVTPLVLNIIRKARIAADKRSIDAYGRSVELAISAYIMDTGQMPTDLDTLEVEYTSKEVVCAVKQLKENGGLYMSQCTVNGKDVKDSSSDDGWYHYGSRDIKDKDYIDMYGDALEAASVAYYQQNNSKVSDYTTLEVNYTGKEVSCDVIINNDGTIYLENCTVAGKKVENYTYGEEKYNSYRIGDEITYNNVEYYVIKDSSTSDRTLTLLKKYPFTNNEIATYSAGTGAYTRTGNTYGGMQFGQTNDYSESYVKAAVDSWASENTNDNDLKEDSTGYKVRLITFDEVLDNLGYEYYERESSSGIVSGYRKTENTPTWVYSYNVGYFTMSPHKDYTSSVMYLNISSEMGSIGVTDVYSNNCALRPVITISKSAL